MDGCCCWRVNRQFAGLSLSLSLSLSHFAIGPTQMMTTAAAATIGMPPCAHWLTYTSHVNNTVGHIGCEYGVFAWHLPTCSPFLSLSLSLVPSLFPPFVHPNHIINRCQSDRVCVVCMYVCLIASEPTLSEQNSVNKVFFAYSAC